MERCGLECISENEQEVKERNMSIAYTGASRKNAVVRMLSSSSSSDQIFTSFFTMVGEQITEYKRLLMKNIKEFKLNVESLKKSLKFLNAKASHVKDRIKFSKGSGERKRKREIEEWLARVKSIENEVFELVAQAGSEGFIRNLMDGGKVADLNVEVITLVEQSQHFDEFLLDTCGTRRVEFLTTRMFGEAFANNLERIWSLLETRKVSSIAIYGMGGVGKTALAKWINNRLLKQSQVGVFWIGVSQEFTIKGLQEKIASFVGLNLSDECDEEIRAVRLHEALSQMKDSVLILDDLWKYIDLVKVGCLVSVEYCRLIITSRSLEVCRQIRCEKVIKVTTLHENEPWELFVESLTLPEKIERMPHVEEIAKSVAKLCGGLPMGIINVAERMRGKISVHSWRVALQELKEHVTRQGGIGDVEVFRVLKYSFDRLNNQSEEFNTFQLCFMYCLFYPQGAKLDKDMLVEKFISEGLVDGGMSRSAQVHQCHFVLAKLVCVCLLETDGFYLKMHDLVRGMALKIVVGKYMVKAGDCSLNEIPHEREWTECLEKACLMECEIRIIRDGTSPNCPKLSTLLLQHNPLKAILDSFFSKMKRLSTLDLCGTLITVLPEIVSDLTSLEALILAYCDYLETVPYLGKLKALRELDLSYTAINEVPQGVDELFNLKFFSIYGTHELQTLPSGFLLKLEHLQRVKLPLQVPVTAEEIENLKEVEQLCGRLIDVRAFNRFIKSQQLDALYQVLVGQNRFEEDEVFGIYDQEVYLSECDLRDEKVLGGKFQVLTIRECEGMSKCLMDDFSPSHYLLESLVMLTIRKCKGIECLLTCPRESPSHFLDLEAIDQDALDDLKGLVWKRGVGVTHPRAVFSSLTNLDISQCNKMRKLGLPASGVPNIEEITISECGEIEEVFEGEGRGSAVLPKLKELRLEKLPKLKTICGATMICNSITTISIYGCPRLMKKVPVRLGVPLPPALSRIEVEREWWESVEWKNPSLPQLLEPFLSLC